MKKSKLKLITKILAIVVICLVSFIGIYMQEQNRMTNIIKEYSLTKDLTGYRQLILELSDATEVKDSEGHVVGNTDDYDDDTITSNEYTKTDNKVNNEEKLNKDNYETTKKIIEKRLKSFGVEEYTLSLDKATGKMYIQIPENNNTDRVVSNIIETGSFEIKDSKDDTIYITNNNLKEVKAMYNTTESGTTVYLDIQLDKEGTNILKELSTNKYAKIEEVNEDETDTQNEEKTENEDSEDEESKDKEDKNTEEEETSQNEISITISGSDMVTTSFDNPVEDGVIDLSMSSASTDNEEINDSLKTTSTIVTLLENGELPLVYKITENQYVSTDISNTLIRNTIVVVVVVLAILLVFMIIKNKLKGLLGVISYIGFIALYLLLIRYTNVAISISGFIAIAIVCLINYILNMKLLSIKKEDNKLYKQEYIKFIVKMIPLLIISITFIFAKWALLSSFGMLLFWGITLIIIYNILVTKKMVD